MIIIKKNLIFTKKGKRIIRNNNEIKKPKKIKLFN